MKDLEAGRSPKRAGGMPARVGRRVAARSIDLLVVALPAQLLAGSLLGPEGQRPGMLSRALAGALFVAILAAYEIATTATFGQTLGKITMGISVLDERNGGLPTLGQSVLRWASLSLFGLALVGRRPGSVLLSTLVIWTILVVLSIVTDEHGRGLHDKVAGTLVVQATEADQVSDAA